MKQAPKTTRESVTNISAASPKKLEDEFTYTPRVRCSAVDKIEENFSNSSSSKRNNENANTNNIELNKDLETENVITDIEKEYGELRRKWNESPIREGF